MSDDIKVEVQLSIYDLNKFSRNVEQIKEKSAGSKKSLIILRNMSFGLLVGILATLLVALLDGNLTMDYISSLFTAYLSSSYLLTIFLIFMFFYFIRSLDKNKTSFALDSRQSKTLLDPINISISSENIFMKDNSSEYKYAWNLVNNITVNDGDFYIYLSTLSVIFIPKRFFSSEEGVQLVHKKCKSWFDAANSNAV